ncbi:hypothetical protein EDF59_1753 [Novosphingobium sp. ST904]|nr:hypothetical protein EDF59_1753 [Novosphingobium sp. ST904]
MPTPAVLLLPDMSLTRWKNQLIVPQKIFEGISDPINSKPFSLMSMDKNVPSPFWKYPFFVNWVKMEKNRPIGVG